MELQTLHQVVDTVADYVRARGGRHEACLLDIPGCVRDTVEHGVHHRATVTLAMSLVQSGHELRHLVGFPKGEGTTNHEGLVEDFDEAADAIVAKVPAEEVIHEAL
jgi:hypothetical protein